MIKKRISYVFRERKLPCITNSKHFAHTRCMEFAECETQSQARGKLFEVGGATFPPSPSLPLPSLPLPSLPLPPLPLPSFPFLSIPFPSLPLEVGPLKSS